MMILNSYRFGGGAPPAWSPANLASLFAWYDASDLSTITESGGAVSQWDDKSGNGIHVSNATAAEQPTTGTRTQNSLNVLDFDGGDALRNTTGLSFLNDAYQENTVFFVIKSDLDEIANYYLGLANDGNIPRRWFLDTRTTPNRLEGVIVDGGSVFLNLSSKLDLNTNILMTAGDTVNEHGYRNGTFENSVAITGTNYSNNAYLNIGCLFGNSTTPAMDGYICEIVICNAFLSTTDRQKAEGYLAHKWGLTANLPAAHPYKMVAP